MTAITVKRLTLITLESLFITALVALARLVDFKPAWFDIAIIALAASFAGRAIAYEGVFEWLRAPFAKVVAHPSGVGEYVDVKDGLAPCAQAIGELVTCPVCAGTWSGLVIFSLYATTEVGHYLAYVLAVGAIGWFVSYKTEEAEWNKNLAWERTGRTRGEGRYADSVSLSYSIFENTKETK
jgi:hypothetical protein